MSSRPAGAIAGVRWALGQLSASWHGIRTRFSDVWRSSLQFRVTVSTLALSTAVVFVLGMVLQNQIVKGLLETKREAAIAQTHQVLQAAERQLATTDAEPDNLGDRLENALDALTSSSQSTGGENSAASSTAGAYQLVLAADAPYLLPEETPSAGPYEKVPKQLARYVQQGKLAYQITTTTTESGRVTYLVVGTPVTSLRPNGELYLLFPLTGAQKTVNTVQNTLLFGSIVLIGLLAGIASLVTRQVVRPVRSVAEAAEEFAGGDRDKRVPVTGQDDLATLADSYNDMAEKIKIQIHQLEEFGRLQRRFTQDVSHELRTPLTTVRMAADVLHASRDEFPAGLGRSAELLVDELGRFEDLLADLLEISRHDARNAELSAETLDLRPLVQGAVDQNRVIAGDTGSAIQVEAPESEVHAEIDKVRIERVLRNLLGNAIDHSEGHPVRVTLAENSNAVAVTVRDYGVGLHKEEFDLVFNRFWRADPSRNRRTGGTGLGLAISHEDAQLHGGSLEVWGEPGKGSCFRLTLPRAQNTPVVSSPLALPPDPPEQQAPAASETPETPETELPESENPEVVESEVESFPAPEEDVVATTVQATSEDAESRRIGVSGRTQED